MTCFSGPVTGLVMFLFRFKRLEAVTLGRIAFHLFLGCIVFYALYKFTFAYFWNRRARRLRTDEMQQISAQR